MVFIVTHEFFSRSGETKNNGNRSTLGLERVHYNLVSKMSEHRLVLYIRPVISFISFSCRNFISL